METIAPFLLITIVVIFVLRLLFLHFKYKHINAQLTNIATKPPKIPSTEQLNSLTSSNSAKSHLVYVMFIQFFEQKNQLPNERQKEAVFVYYTNHVGEVLSLKCSNLLHVCTHLNGILKENYSMTEYIEIFANSNISRS